MLTSKSPPILHTLQNISLILLSFIFLPLDTLILSSCYLYHALIQSDVQIHRARRMAEPGFIPQTILVTGVGMTKGLALARLFYEAGHTVIGADFEGRACGRFSKSLSKFYGLRKPNVRSGSAVYIQDLLDVVLREKVEIWVSCSGVASAVEDGEAKEIVEARTECRAIQFNVKDTQVLHEKNTFIERAAELGLTVPDTHVVRTPGAAIEILADAPKDRKYILKPIGVVDAMRADMTLLSRSTLGSTTRHIETLPISKDAPWILQQFIKGSEYCTHSLVVKGQVKAFVACPSAELLMHYEALPVESALSKAMLSFTETFAKNGGESFTGHLSFDFMVENDGSNDARDIVLYPIECNPRAHTAVALFNRSTDMVDTYLSVLNSVTDTKQKRRVVTPVQQYKYYWIGHDLVSRLLLPTLNLITLRLPLSTLVSGYRDFLLHVVLWRDGTLEVWDPLPWWWLYHVYWPKKFLNCVWTGVRWSRLNVSTTKMFEC